jgi:hypothetical protein
MTGHSKDEGWMGNVAAGQPSIRPNASYHYTMAAAFCGYHLDREMITPDAIIG